MSNTLTQTSRGTPMGELLRRYWVPVVASQEILEPDGPQVRVQIMGEKLIVFRDTEGEVGVMSEFCSHRGVSLYFARNEEGGLRCAYHGLKFNRHGQCVDVPSAPQMCEKMNIKAYPCVEKAGLVWAYLGPKEFMPEPPELEWCDLPQSHVFISRRLQECNFLQAMEGGIDTAHVSYVHRYEVDRDPMHVGTEALKYIKADGNVVFTIEQTEFGLTLYGRRNADEDHYYWRITQWIFPWYTLIPPFGEHALGGHLWVPVDDHHCMAWSINFHPHKPLSAQEVKDMSEGKGIHVTYEDKTTFRPTQNKDNDYLMDRTAQKNKESYSGIFGISMQDASLQESMGVIQNHAEEKLLPTDKAIVMARRMMYDTALGLSQNNTPPALDPKAHQVRAAGVILPKSKDPIEWAHAHLAGGLHHPLHTL
jgi:phenylpropionate dioxygenase-like ring-hydroxylating dioxygenase large terminal subunit